MTVRAVPKVLITTIGAVSLACASGDRAGTGPAFSVRDSAGIEIADVAHAEWSAGEGWTVGSEPVLSVGSLEGDDAYQLFRVSRAIRLANGSIVVANGGTSQLRWYDADGRFVRNAGGQGEGPGEFGRLFGLALSGDELIAHDFQLQRLTRFDTAGALLGTVQLAPEPGLPIEVWPAGDGWIAFIVDMPYDVTSDATYRRRNSVYVRYAADGAFADTIAELPGNEWIMRGGSVEGGFTMSLAEPLISHSSQQTVIDGRLVAGSTDRFEIRIYDRAGALARVIRDPARNLPVSGSEWDAVVAENMAEAETPEQRRTVQELAEIKPAPETRPAFDRFLGDRLGYLWVAPWRPAGGQPVPWLVVDVAGGVLGSVDLPDGFRPTDIGNDYILGVIRDDLDVEQVRMYPLHRTR